MSAATIALGARIIGKDRGDACCGVVLLTALCLNFLSGNITGSRARSKLNERRRYLMRMGDLIPSAMME